MNTSHRITIKGTLLIVCFVIGCYAVYCMAARTRTALCTFDTTLIHFDPLFSQTLCQRVTAWLEQQPPSLVVYQDLKKQFPGIASVIAQQKNSGKTVLYLKALCPRIYLNNERVLTAECSVVPREHFDDDCINQLPTITMHAKHECLTRDFMTTLHKIVPNFVEQFNITLIDKTRIWLTDKTEPSWNMLIDVSSALHEELLKRYQAVVQAMKEKDSKGKKNQEWVADMRFAHQVIVQGTRGVGYEAS